MAALGHDVEEDGNGDYTTLEACLNANEQDLTDGAGDTYTVRICGTDLGGNGWTNADATLVTINGWTTSATCYIRIYTTSSARHDGKWNTGKYRLVVSLDHCMSLVEEYVRLEGVQVGADANKIAVYISISNATSDIRISHSIIKGWFGVDVNVTAATVVTIFNCIIYDCTWGIAIWGAAGIIYCYNVTAHNCTTAGFQEGLGTITCKNCIAFDCGDDFNGVTTVDYCASDDNDGTNNVDETAGGKTWADAFTDYTNDDFSLKAGSLMIGAGTDNPEGGTLYDDDIIGTSRTSTWDVGAFEYAAVTTIAMMSDYYRRLRRL